MFNDKRIAALEARVAELEKPQTVAVRQEVFSPSMRGCHYYEHNPAPLLEVVSMLCDHLGLIYEPKKETTTGPALVKKPETASTTSGYAQAGDVGGGTYVWCSAGSAQSAPTTAKKKKRKK